MFNVFEISLLFVNRFETFGSFRFDQIETEFVLLGRSHLLERTLQLCFETHAISHKISNLTYAALLSPVE